MAVNTKIAVFGALIAIFAGAYVASIKMKASPTIVPEAVEVPFEMHLNDNINKKLSSKANYDYGTEKYDIPETCKVIHTEVVQRHGARHLNKISKIEDAIKLFTKHKEEGHLKNDLLLNWANELKDLEINNTGGICKTGEIEIQGIAERLRDRIHLSKEDDILVENTYKKRTQQTRDVYLSSLLPEDYPEEKVHRKEAYNCEDIIGTDGQVNKTVYEEYAPLRFFSICPKYTEYKNDSSVRYAVEHSFENNPEMGFIDGNNKIWKAVLNDTKDVTKEEKVELLHHMYTMCQFEASCYNNYNNTCELLNREPVILDQLQYDDDMRLYTYKGEGNPLNFNMACPLGRSLLSGLGANLIAHLPEGERKDNITKKYGMYFDFENAAVNKVHLRFGHAESILPLYFLFIMKPPRFQNNRMRFSGNDFIPMSANFQIDLLQCGDDFYFQFLANEVPIRMDLPNTPYKLLFEVEPFLEQWVTTLKYRDMENCLYDDFVKLCDEPKCKA